jgi:ribosomal protein S18 acetylase RimI-like enzyme
MTFLIRPYTANDRPAVRQICFETGYMGEPVDWLYGDRESFNDLITRYYTDQEPESIFLAERDGQVVGYLTGCVDSERTRGVGAREMQGVLLHGGLIKPGSARFLWRLLFDILRDRDTPSEYLKDPRYPAHLHIDLLPEGRGHGMGRRLMTAWLDRLRERGVPGVHLGTFAENANAIAFFQACGFERHGDPQRAPGFRTREGKRMHVQWMTRSV